MSTLFHLLFDGFLCFIVLFVSYIQLDHCEFFVLCHALVIV